MASQNVPRASLSTTIGLVVVTWFILAAVGSLLYFTQPNYGHFYGLLDLGFFALIVGILFYVVQALSRNPAPFSWAAASSFWFGVAVLLGSDLLTPDSAFGGSGSSITFGTDRILLLVVILFIVMAGLLVQRWRQISRQVDRRRSDERAAWRQAAGVSPPPSNPAAPNLPPPQGGVPPPGGN
jgi:hypothetical protein